MNMRSNSLKNIILIGTAAISVAACNATIPYKEGSSIAEYRIIDAQCIAEAAKNVPVVMATYKTPVEMVPIEKTCVYEKSEDGLREKEKCTIVGGYQKGGEIVEYDKNEELRNYYYKSCLTSKGYVDITLPICKKDDLPNRVLSEREKMQSLSDNSCVVKNKGSTGWVVNPR